MTTSQGASKRYGQSSAIGSPRLLLHRLPYNNQFIKLRLNTEIQTVIGDFEY